jgi:HEAT repeat protein
MTPALGVRSAAADALGKIRDARAGNALLRRFDLETDIGVKRMLAAVLGAVGHRPAIQLLVALLSSDDRSMRGSAAWALGNLRAEEAIAPLEESLTQETESYAIERMTQALEWIHEVKT